MFRWCREGESNPQGTKYRRILSPLRLPVPPSRPGHRKRRFQSIGPPTPLQPTLGREALQLPVRLQRPFATAPFTRTATELHSSFLLSGGIVLRDDERLSLLRRCAGTRRARRGRPPLWPGERLAVLRLRTFPVLGSLRALRSVPRSFLSVLPGISSRRASQDRPYGTGSRNGEEKDRLRVFHGGLP